MTEPTDYTTAQVAEAAGVTRTRILNLVKELGITPRPIGATFLFTQEQFDLIMSRRTKRGRDKTTPAE